MGRGQPVSAEELFAGHPFAREVFDAVEAVAAGLGPYSVRVTKSQATFRRRRGFAFVWIPGRYLAHPAADVVLSIALPRHDPSPRFKEVAHPAPAQRVHHLEVRSLGDVDAEVVGWLREAAAAAD